MNQIGIDIKQHMQAKALNLIGKDTMKRFLALLQRTNVLIPPDSSPAHMVTGPSILVIGLYAASNLKGSGPYSGQQYCVNKYDEAAHAFKKPPRALKWGTKLEYEGAMN